MTTRKKNKNQQKEGSGFIKKVSSLFNLDTVIFFIIFLCCFCFCFYSFNPPFMNIALQLTPKHDSINISKSESYIKTSKTMHFAVKYKFTAPNYQTSVNLRLISALTMINKPKRDVLDPIFPTKVRVCFSTAR